MLETRIGALKGEYAVLISQSQELKHEMLVVKEKVTRSTTLLGSLSQVLRPYLAI